LSTGAVTMSATLSRVRLVAGALTALLALSLAPLAGPGTPAFAGPIADSDVAYELCGRVFPDPQAYWLPTLGEGTPHPGTGVSPWAKGNLPCAARTFISYDEAVRGITFLAEELDVTKDFVELIDITTTDDPRITEVLDAELGDGWSEGLPTATGGRDRVPLYLVKVTAPEGAVLVEGVEPVAEADRDHFVWALSIHGIERAGVEGGLRAVEDLATWASQEPTRPLLETYPGDTIVTEDGLEARNLPVGEVLMRSVSYFVMPNPDGWRRGDLDQVPAGTGTSYMRYNGNGMDNNRDWPEIGWTDASFSPWSESETRTYGKVLQNLTDNWTGGIDLHGMVVANAFSYTLVGGSQRPYGKNQRVMQFVRQAWADAEERLIWSPQIKPNDAAEQCVRFDGVTPTGEINPPPACDQRVYGVQYGTIWDTINYTVTGALGNWIDSPVGLNADGIDNEMMLSHLGNCGIGNCYVPDAEQLHVDGNKSLVYAMLNFSLQPPDAVFDVGADVAYLVNPRRLVDPGVEVPQAPPGAVAPPPQSGTATHTGSGTTVLAEFTVDNAGGQTFVGGIAGSVRWTHVLGQSVGDVNSVSVQYRNPDTGQWSNRLRYSGGPVYLTPGQASFWNYPEDGDYRFVVTGAVPSQVQWELRLSTTPAWEQPIQDPFDVSNMDFFAELEPFVGSGSSLTALAVDRVLAGERDLGDFDTLVVVDDALLPGSAAADEQAHQGALDLPPTAYGAADRARMGAVLRDFVEAGGNLVLSDDALRALEWMGLVAEGAVGRRGVYAGHVNFTTGLGYDDPLAEGLNRPGAAEGRQQRRQVVEPVPIGFNLSSSQPQWYVQTAAVEAAGGRVVGTDGGVAGRAALAEIPHGDGVVRILGSFAPFPTTAFYHPFGLSSYAVTDNGYTLARNLWAWDNVNQNPSPDLVDDEITWVASDVPTRVYVDGTRF
jgi:hypothetical protein